MNNILNMMFTMLKLAVSNSCQAELSTVANATDPMPNLVVVINNLGNCCIEPRDFSHVRVRICHAANKFRFLVEDVILSERDETEVDLEKFWENCPYGEYNSRYDLLEVDYEDADDLLTWTINRGKDIKQSDILSWNWTIA